VQGGTIRDARVALGGVAHAPWRALMAEAALIGKPAAIATYAAAADAELRAAKPQRLNGFKIPWRKQRHDPRARARSEARHDRRAGRTRRRRGEGHRRGALPYEEPLANVAYGVIVTSTIAAGRVTSIDAHVAHVAARRVLVLTHENAPQVQRRRRRPQAAGAAGRRVFYDRQPVALVVADSFEALPTRRRACGDLRPQDAGDDDELAGRADVQAAAGEQQSPPTRRAGTSTRRSRLGAGEARQHLRDADRVPQPDGTARDAGDVGRAATSRSTTRRKAPFPRRASVAKIFGDPRHPSVRVEAKFVGGGFGSKGGTNPHCILAAMARQGVGPAGEDRVSPGRRCSAASATGRAPSSASASARTAAAS
jgi:CO/xanthine dehydrogenase Mo-binding subunit